MVAMKKMMILLCLALVPVFGKAQDTVRLLLPASDYGLLQRVQTQERPTALMAARLVSNYQTQRRLQAEYDSLKTAALYVAFRAAQADGRVLQDSLSKSWASIFDHKLYVNTFILDRLGLEQLLDDQEAALQRLNRLTAHAREQGWFEALPVYFYQKQFLLGVEAQTARVLGLSSLSDSLGRARSVLTNVSPEFPAPSIQERQFIEYTPVSFAAARTVVAALPVVPVGDVYRVWLVESRAAVNPLLFRGMTPVYVQAMPNGYRYVTGAYATLPEAEKAAALLKGKGFRAAAPVAWRAGIYDPRPTETITVRDASGRLVEKEL